MSSKKLLLLSWLILALLTVSFAFLLRRGETARKKAETQLEGKIETIAQLEDKLVVCKSKHLPLDPADPGGSLLEE